jgi:hypothetical protein
MKRFRLWLARKILPGGYKLVRVASGWHKKRKTPLEDIVNKNKENINEKV